MMTINVSDPKHEFANEWALNVRAFYGINSMKLKVKYVDMMNVGPEYNPYKH